jgi:hypothetical protein
MRARRRWTPVAAAFTSDPRWPGAGNARYAPSRALLDLNRSAPRSVPHATIDGWREALRHDGEMRAALLNPARYQPRCR